MVNRAATLNLGQNWAQFGPGFGTDSVVYWNGAALPSSYGTGTKVTAQVAAMNVMSAGMFPVYVRSGGKNSNMINFTVQ